MYNDSSYADVLESYTIAEEGIFSKVKDKIKERKQIKMNKKETIIGPNVIASTPMDEMPADIVNILKKAGCIWKSFKNDYSYFTDLVCDCDYPEKISNSDMKKIHDVAYNEDTAIDFFAPANNKEDIDLVKKYKPVPIYAHGNGDHYCITSTGEIKEYIHDVKEIFDSPYAQDYRNYQEWLNSWYKKNN